MNALELLKEQHRHIESLFDALLTCEPGRRSECFRELAGALTQHSILESSTFYPALERHGLQEEATEALRAHEGIKYQLEEVCVAKEGKDAFHACVEALRADQQAHVADEEQRLFTLAQQSLGEELLEELAEDMRGILRLWQANEPSAKPADETTPWLFSSTAV